MNMSVWDPLDAELRAWSAAGRTVTLWWRDDDAVSVTPALEHMARLSATHEAPVTLAVIPAEVEPVLARWVADQSGVSVAQHGLSHANHAGPQDGGASEFPASRPLAACMAALAEGWCRMTDVFGVEGAVPMLVAPFNKVGPDVPSVLPTVGLSALSVHGSRATWPSAPVAIVNTHVDLLRWRPDAEFIGVDKAVRRLVGALAARRLGRDEAGVPQDPAEPVGLLTHHRVHGDDLWAFLADLLPRLRHPSVRWAEASALIAEGAPS
ncbi:hypothetical protein F1188_08880 [Roseospira marina]|uniref:Polysaccharide deacetylase n=1 Tax=Roseospira marina TaxID=140057 RepID=A0A5M6IBR1_9PROT|nr:hypothetical protein [Roseospira marina]KAA5605730.1 hypothetical protein F1188_08880 [Roseospira marina]MBB4313531.1 hypothetical protein [Roseospira marina]MBB5086693.1 hypothetical protein [Roseospira marina]